MCGRTSLFAPRPELEERFGASVVGDYVPRYNIAPGQDLEVVTRDSPDEIRSARWGLTPAWMDDPEEGFINARSETVAEKPAFRDAWDDRPCLVLSSGFYEWQAANGGPKEPYRIHRRDDVAFAMAGIWERSAEGAETVTILTTDPNETVADIHDRMPVVLPRSAEDEYLTGDPDDRAALCRPYPGADMEAYAIDQAVNDPANDDPSILEPAASTQSGLEEFG